MDNIQHQHPRHQCPDCDEQFFDEKTLIWHWWFGHLIGTRCPCGVSIQQEYKNGKFRKYGPYSSHSYFEHCQEHGGFIAHYHASLIGAKP